MKNTIIIKNKEVKLKNPILIAGFPGVGNVGKIVVRHLKREFRAQRIATVYSPGFPPQVMMKRNGGLRFLNNSFYLIKRQRGDSDIVLLTGDVQAMTQESQYEINEAIVDFFVDELGGKFIYTIGGYNSGEGSVEKPRVFANATRPSVFEKFKKSDILIGKSRGTIMGSAGMILAFAKMKKIQGICLMGETKIMDLDASAAKAVIMVLSEAINLKVDTNNLDIIIRNTADAIKEAEKQMNSQGIQGPEENGGSPSYIR